MHHSTRRTALVTHCTQMFLRKMLGYHSWIVYRVRERKHYPRTQVLMKTGNTDCPSNSSSLPLSMSSCSNELDHTSDAAEDHPDGQDSRYRVTTLFFFYLFFYILLQQWARPYIRPLISLLQFPVGFLQKLLPVIQRRSIFAAPSSATPPS
jgi:hypothetical protein